MLKVSIHIGELSTLATNNQLGVLDVAYSKQEALAQYMVALSMRPAGEYAPATVPDYPRWSASLWDLVARALTRVLYQAEQAPPTAKPDRRCAYATRLCGTIEGVTATDRGLALGAFEIAQRGNQRGTYTATFTEDILGSREVEFDYGCKALNPADLLLRAICWALFGTELLGARPKLILPPSMVIDGQDRFHIEALTEPAKTGFKRFQAARLPTAAPEPLPLSKDYVQFLMRG